MAFPEERAEINSKLDELVKEIASDQKIPQCQAISIVYRTLTTLSKFVSEPIFRQLEDRVIGEAYDRVCNICSDGKIH